MTPKKWIETTGAIGIISKSGRYGGTFAHKDIAFENLCIIEVKKSKSNIPFDYDFTKLKAYTSAYYGNDLKYKIGIFIEFSTGTSILGYQLKTFLDGQEIPEM